MSQRPGRTQRSETISREPSRPLSVPFGSASAEKCRKVPKVYCGPSGCWVGTTKQCKCTQYQCPPCREAPEPYCENGHPHGPCGSRNDPPEVQAVTWMHTHYFTVHQNSETCEC